MQGFSQHIWIPVKTAHINASWHISRSWLQSCTAGAHQFPGHKEHSRAAYQSHLSQPNFYSVKEADIMTSINLSSLFANWFQKRQQVYSISLVTNWNSDTKHNVCSFKWSKCFNVSYRAVVWQGHSYKTYTNVHCVSWMKEIYKILSNL